MDVSVNMSASFCDLYQGTTAAITRSTPTAASYTDSLWPTEGLRGRCEILLCSLQVVVYNLPHCAEPSRPSILNKTLMMVGVELKSIFSHL